MKHSRLRPTWTRGLALSVGLVLAAVAGCSSSDTGGSGDSTLRIALNPATPPSLPLVADHNGDFKKKGLSVKITQLPSTSITTFAPALGRQYDIAWGTPADVIAASAQGIDIKIIAGAYVDAQENQQSQIFSSKSSKVTSLKDLAGKRIATPSLSGTIYLSLLTALTNEGIDPKDVDLVEVPFPNMLDQLNAGRVDAVATIQPFIGAVKAAGHTALGDPFLSVDSPATVGMWIADREWAKKNPDKVTSFIDSLDAADEWVQANEKEARSFLATALKLPPEVMANVPLPDWETDIAPEAIAPWIEAVDQAGQVNGKLPTADELVSGS